MPQEGPPDDDAAAAIEKWIETQGYGLEYIAAAAFERAGFVVRQGLTYRDPAGGKVREVDVQARVALRARKVEMHVAIECKRSKAPWVTRTTRLALRKGHVQWGPIASASVRDYLERNRLVLTDAFELPSPTDFDVVQAFRDDPKSGDPAYGALSQAVSAAAGLLSSRELLPNPAIVHPVIVLGAPLFRATFLDFPNTVIESIPWARIHWSGSQNLRWPVLVDIVTAGAVEAYAVAMRHSLGELVEDLEGAPGDFRQPAATGF